MKNKGRKHKAGANSQLRGICNCKSMITQITRPITSMSSKGHGSQGKGYSSKFNKKKWAKRVRGYFKSQTKSIDE
jgi:hypothetical protein